jgi:hypothetical protein
MIHTVTSSQGACGIASSDVKWNHSHLSVGVTGVMQHIHDLTRGLIVTSHGVINLLLLAEVLDQKRFDDNLLLIAVVYIQKEV